MEGAQRESQLLLPTPLLLVCFFSVQGEMLILPPRSYYREPTQSCRLDHTLERQSIFPSTSSTEL